MARIINGVGREAVDVILFNRPSQEFSTAIHAMNMNSNNIPMTAAAANFFQTTENVFKRASESVINSQLEKINAVYYDAWTGDYFRPLYTMDEIQSAPPMMIPYIMASPIIDELYLNSTIYGYGADYVRPSFNELEDNPYYQSVMNGMIVDDTVTQYFVDEAISLSTEQQFTILDIWNSASDLIDLGIDPTGESFGD